VAAAVEGQRGGEAAAFVGDGFGDAEVGFERFAGGGRQCRDLGREVLGRQPEAGRPQGTAQRSQHGYS
jgi:hypothetical protein